MKKILTLLAFVMTCQLTFSQTYQDVINNFKDDGNYVELTKELLKIAADAGQMPLEKDFVKRIDCMKILAVTDADKLEAFAKQVKALEVRYNKLGDEESEDGEKMFAFYDGEDTEKIKALIVGIVQAGGGQFIVIEGNLSSKDLDDLSKMAD